MNTMFITAVYRKIPLFQIRNLVSNSAVKIYAEVEWRQLTGNVIAEAAYLNIEDAIHTLIFQRANN